MKRPLWWRGCGLQSLVAAASARRNDLGRGRDMLPHVRTGGSASLRFNPVRFGNAAAAYPLENMVIMAWKRLLLLGNEAPPLPYASLRDHSSLWTGAAWVAFCDFLALYSATDLRNRQILDRQHQIDLEHGHEMDARVAAIR